MHVPNRSSSRQGCPHYRVDFAQARDLWPDQVVHPEGPGVELWYHSPEEHGAISAAELSTVMCSGVRACPVSWASCEHVVEKQPGRVWKGVLRNGRVFVIAQCGFPRAVLQAAGGGILLQPLGSKSFGCSGLQP